MKNKHVKRLILAALFMSLTIVLTLFVYIPIGSQGGYINLGDSIIVVTSITLGPIYGMIVGAIGSAIADLILAPSYAIFTFIIKGIEGLLIGVTYKLIKNKFGLLLSSIIGLSFMVIGYYFVGVIMYESFVLPFIDTFFNFLQMVFCLLVSQVIFFTIGKYLNRFVN